MMNSAIEAEQSVIGSILIDARCLPAVEELLRPEDLALEVNQALYQAALELRREGRPIDPNTVLDQARRKGTDIPVSYVLELMDITPTAAHVGEYAAITRDQALRRGLLAMAEGCRLMLEGHDDTQDIFASLAQQLDALQQEGTARDLVTPDQAAIAFYAHRDAINSGIASGYVHTGYQDLDGLLGGGLLSGGMYVLAARPGMGKTTLALNIIDRQARRGLPVLFVSLEMDQEQIQAKRLSRECGVSSHKLLMGPLADEECQRVAEAMEALRAMPVYLNAKPAATVSQIEVMGRKVRGLGLIVIDYIGKVAPEKRGRRSSRYEDVTEISGDIKTMARRLKVPVLALCQLNRGLILRQDPTPQLSDLRDSGSIEQDADGVIFLHREDYYSAWNGGARISSMRVIVAKNRHGPTGECSMAFDLEHSKVTAAWKRDGPRKPRQEEPEYKQKSFYPLPDSEPLPWEDEYNHVEAAPNS